MKYLPSYFQKIPTKKKDNPMYKQNLDMPNT